MAASGGTGEPGISNEGAGLQAADDRPTFTKKLATTSLTARTAACRELVGRLGNEAGRA